MMDFNTWGPMTVLVVGLTLIAALVGGAVVVLGDQSGPDALTFGGYLDHMSKFAIALGIVAVGRGVRLSGTTPTARRRRAQT